MEKEPYADDCTTLSHNGYKFTGTYIRLEEVERFEKSNKEPIEIKKTLSKKEEAEEQAALFTTLKEDCLDKKEIAKRIKLAFPQICNYRLGKLITEAPGVHVSKDAYRKRGQRLLK